VLTSNGREFGERFGLVDDVSLWLAPAKPVLCIIDKTGPASPIMLAVKCKETCGRLISF
jgi:hypothetical protein